MPPCINATISIIKNLQHDFSKKKGGGVKGRLEFFQKFIRIGSGTPHKDSTNAEKCPSHKFTPL